MTIKTAGIIALTFLVLTIVFQNTQVVTFKIFLWQISLSRILILIPLAAVFVLGFLMGKYYRRR